MKTVYRIIYSVSPLLLLCLNTVAADTETHSLDSEQSNQHRILLADGNPRLLTIRQIGIDVVVEVRYNDSDKIVFNSPGIRNASEFILLQGEPGTTANVIVAAAKPQTPRGSYTIALQSIARESALHRAAGFASEAAQKFAMEDIGSMEQAALLYENLLAEESETSLRRYANYYLAMLYLQLDRYDDAIAAFEKASSAWQHEDAEMHIASKRGAALATLYSGRHGDSHEQFLSLQSETQELFETQSLLEADKIEVRSNTCLALLYLGRFDEVDACYRPVFNDAARIGDFSAVGLAHNNLGGMHMLSDNLAAAIAHFEHAVQAYEQSESRVYLIDTYNNLGMSHRRSGELSTALSWYRRSEAIGGDSLSANRKATLFNNIGHLYNILGDYQQARDYLRAAVDIRGTSGPPRHLAISRSNLARAERELGSSDEALHLRLLALSHYVTQEDLSGQITVLTELISDQTERRDFEAAKLTIARGLSLLQQQHDTRQHADLHLSSAKLWLRSDDSEQALSAANSAYLSYQQLEYRPGQISTLATIANIRRASGQYTESLAAAKQAMLLANQVQTGLQGSALGAAFRRDILDLYVDAVNALLADNADNAQAILEALALHDEYRRRSLHALTTTELSSTEADDVGALRRQLNGISNALTRKIAKDGEDDRAVSALRLEYYELLEELEEKTQRAVSQDTQFSPQQLQRLRLRMPEDEVIVSFLLDDPVSYAWLLSKQQLELVRLPARSRITTYARAAAESLHAPATGSRRALSELGSLIIQPLNLEAEKRRITFIADDVLHYIPFAALSASGDRYKPLLEQHELLLAQSVFAALSMSAPNPSNSDSPLQVTVVADPVYTSRDPRLAQAQKPDPGERIPADDTVQKAYPGTSWQRLPWSGHEAQNIMDTHGPSNVTLLSGFDASLAGIKSVGHVDILHIASHGVADDTRIDQTGLIFSGYDAAGRDIDSFMNVNDIAYSAMRPKTVVLSACNTAIGPMREGRGLSSLTQAFFRSGARSIISSLWAVKDRATAKMMEIFHTQYRSDRDPVAALRSAQLSMLQTDRWSDPHYWAAFQAYSGDAQGGE